MNHGICPPTVTREVNAFALPSTCRPCEQSTNQQEPSAATLTQASLGQPMPCLTHADRTPVLIRNKPKRLCSSPSFRQCLSAPGRHHLLIVIVNPTPFLFLVQGMPNQHPKILKLCDWLQIQVGRFPPLPVLLCSSTLNDAITRDIVETQDETSMTIFLRAFQYRIYDMKL